MPTANSTPQVVRLDQALRLEQHAKYAIQIYNQDLAAGAEPTFPDWTVDLMAILELTDTMVVALKLAHEALVRSTPIMIHFPAPMKQHYDAKFAVRKAITAAGCA